ncbi:glycosyltransferase family 2 protein [Candidatus Beckwithbacteria bacterium CG10_big_fil_rev_8_21_14_0_10_34_10]|uniref:Glycosyltransferase family 2 protein n=1 Tax=Candidatus Beckwithbacteria bacterium CG10_big_fil_rev_8_21_14_0_10_34_10 TaxID=1974495 RepID=A0A2H0WA18_9BACT|nr:MAG: glycosyltransferase family 2 protein [Candidatus Beckwithbacteria bacterium CG10_big_fil_rev_8_21_14_0_10_34_10]
MKIFIIILNYNGKKNTLECLGSLEKLEVGKIDLKTIVVDNASNDGSIKAIKKKFFQIKVIESKENLGFGAGNNAGIRYALKFKPDFLLLLNNDTLVDKNLLVDLIKGVKERDKIALVSPKIYFAKGFEFHKERYKEKERGKVIWYAGGRIDWKNILASHRGIDEVDIGRYNSFSKTDFSTGCCMLIRASCLEKIGLLNEKYFMYWEDIDFSLRAKKAGFEVFYDPNPFLWHKNASASGGAGNKTSVYYQTRNRLFFAFKYASLKAKLSVLKEGLKYLFKVKGNKYQQKAVKDFLALKFSKANL